MTQSPFFVPEYGALPGTLIVVLLVSICLWKNEKTFVASIDFELIGGDACLFPTDAIPRGYSELNCLGGDQKTAFPVAGHEGTEKSLTSPVNHLGESPYLAHVTGIAAVISIRGCEVSNPIIRRRKSGSYPAEIKALKYLNCAIGLSRSSRNECRRRMVPSDRPVKHCIRGP